MPAIITGWERTIGAKATKLRALYSFLAGHLYDQYEPSKRILGTSSAFLDRIEIWLSNLQNDSDRWNAFRSLEYFLFLGADEFAELYRSACDHSIIPWLCDGEAIDIFDVAAPNQIDKALKKTWICPVTDSLRINSFLHITGLPGLKFRPDWHSLSQFGDRERLRKYIRRTSIKRLVLVEDFVGTGSQFSKALRFAAKCFDGEILAVPLVICHPGDKKLRDVALEIGPRMTYAPSVVVPENCLLGPLKADGEPALFESLRATLNAAFKIMGSPELDGAEFGYGRVGSLLCTFSNCPNNSPPMYHFNSHPWKPIFPRAGRRS